MAVSSIGFRALAEKNHELMFDQPVREVAESFWWAGRFLQSWHTQLNIDMGVPMPFSLHFRRVEGIPVEAAKDYANKLMQSFNSPTPNLVFFSPETITPSLFFTFELLKSRFQHVADALGSSYEEAVYTVFEAYRNFAADEKNKEILESHSEFVLGGNNGILEPDEKTS